MNARFVNSVACGYKEDEKHKREKENTLRSSPGPDFILYGFAIRNGSLSSPSGTPYHPLWMSNKCLLREFMMQDV